MYRLVILPEPEEQLRKMPPDIKRRIREGLDRIAGNPTLGEELHEELRGFYRYRVARYRIIYKILDEKKWIEVHAIGHRGTIYEDFSQE